MAPDATIDNLPASVPCYSDCERERGRMAATARELMLHQRAPQARDIARAPGDGLLHPLVLVALAALVVNDHLLKPTFPGVVTGKLSDVAGLLLAPVVAVAAIELVAAAAGRDYSP